MMRVVATSFTAMVIGLSVGGTSVVAAQPMPGASSCDPSLSAQVPLATESDLDEAGDIATVVGPLVALLALAEAVRRAARQAKDSRIGALLAWSANTVIGLQSARLLFSDKRSPDASVTELRELSEESRTLAVNLQNQATALAISLPGSAPPSGDFPHKLSLLVTQLRLLSTDASRTSSDCGEAENPIPYPDALVERRHARAIENCTHGRRDVEVRLELVRGAAVEALTEFKSWIRRAKKIDETTRVQLERLAETAPSLSAENADTAA